MESTFDEKKSPSILKSGSKIPKVGLRKTVTFEDEIQANKLQFDVRELEVQRIDQNSDTFDELVTNLNNLNIVSQTEMCSKELFTMLNQSDESTENSKWNNVVWFSLLAAVPLVTAASFLLNVNDNTTSKDSVTKIMKVLKNSFNL